MRASAVLRVLKPDIGEEFAMRESSSGPIQALIVDDEEAVRVLVGRVLSEAGYETFVARDGLEAQGLAAAMGRVDLLVTDEMMPRMTGHELAKWLRARE